MLIYNISLVIFMILVFLDSSTTIHLVNTFGPEGETNPLMRFLFRFDPIVVLNIKLIIAIITSTYFSWVMEYYIKKNDTRGVKILKVIVYSLVLIFTVVVGWNIYNIACL